MLTLKKSCSNCMWLQSSTNMCTKRFDWATPTIGFPHIYSCNEWTSLDLSIYGTITSDKINAADITAEPMCYFNTILDPIIELLHKKNADYGNSYEKLREEYGPVAFHVRIADKFNRIKQLDQTDTQQVNESVTDTISDIIGYCTLELKYRTEHEE